MHTFPILKHTHGIAGEAAEKYIDVEWLPPEFNLDEKHYIGGLWTEPKRFIALSIGPWLERRLAGVIRVYLQLGYQGMCSYPNEIRARVRGG